MSYIKNNILKSLNTTGSYDYAIDSNSLITENKKQESVKIAAQKALDDIFSSVAVKSIKYEDK
jgi:hypothetical protein